VAVVGDTAVAVVDSQTAFGTPLNNVANFLVAGLNLAFGGMALRDEGRARRDVGSARTSQATDPTTEYARTILSADEQRDDTGGHSQG
jgi:hypothetical protein